MNDKEFDQVPQIIFNSISSLPKIGCQGTLNCRQWLARGHPAEFVSIDGAKSMLDIAADGKILVWNGHHDKSDAFMNDLVTRLILVGLNLFCFLVVRIFTTRWCIDLWDNCMGLVAMQWGKTSNGFSFCTIL